MTREKTIEWWKDHLQQAPLLSTRWEVDYWVEYVPMWHWKSKFPCKL